MSTKGPGFFSNIGQKARDILAIDYTSDQKFSIASSSSTGVDLKSALVKRGGLFHMDVGAGYHYKNNTFHVKVDAESNVFMTYTVSDIMPSTKASASIRLPDYTSGKLEARCLTEHVAFSAAVGLNCSPAIDFSATIGTPRFAFGAETSYWTATAKFAKYNTGVSLTNPTSNASVILADKGDSLNASYLQYLDYLNGGAVVGEMSRRFSTNESTLTVGCSYVVDPLTVVKVKLNNHGNLAALLQHEFAPKTLLTMSGAFQTMALERAPKFGFALSFKP